MIQWLPDEIKCELVRFLNGKSRQKLSYVNKHFREFVKTEHIRLIKVELFRVVRKLVDVDAPFNNLFIKDVDIAWTNQDGSIDSYFTLLMVALNMIFYQDLVQLFLFFVPENYDEKRYNLFYSIALILNSSSIIDSANSGEFKRLKIFEIIKFFHPFFDNSDEILQYIHPSVIDSAFQRYNNDQMLKATGISWSQPEIVLTRILLKSHNFHFSQKTFDQFTKFGHNFSGCHIDLLSYTDEQMIEHFERFEHFDYLKQSKKIKPKNESLVHFPKECYKDNKFLKDFIRHKNNLFILDYFSEQTIQNRSTLIDFFSYLVFPFEWLRTYNKRSFDQNSAFESILLNSIRSKQYKSIVKQDHLYFCDEFNITKELVPLASMPFEKWSKICELSNKLVWKRFLDLFNFDDFFLLTLCAQIESIDDINSQKLWQIMKFYYIHSSFAKTSSYYCLDKLFKMNSSKYELLEKRFFSILESPEFESEIIHLFD